MRLVDEVETTLDAFDTNLYPIKPTIHACQTLFNSSKSNLYVKHLIDNAI
jgi:hypothetical protein